VLAYSGHGSRTHGLVPVDADPADLRATGLPLDELTELVSAIPARLLLVVLDCCFSGAAGAKVLSAPSARAVDASRSLAGKLKAMAGRGRIILTAAAADKPAFEDPLLRHGLLTHALLDALTGGEQVRRAEGMPVYRLHSYVVDRVSSGAAGYRRRQTPHAAWPGRWGARVARVCAGRAVPVTVPRSGPIRPN
jgi:helicase